jgi:FtsP/CotA-like multicopper oxidase with cupredoxin domain
MVDNMVLYLSTPTRRTFLTSAAVLAAGALLPVSVLRAASVKAFGLKSAPGRKHLVPEPYGETTVWVYNDALPGPEIRVRQGDRLRVVVENGLDEETTVHWHGVRTPNAMDGVPHLTQAPIAPGESFTYEFDAVDAGTFWYHPHQNSTVQVGRGLCGPLIIEEAKPVRVDRELTWVLDDWRLTKAAAISDDFNNRHDLMHNGRVGNTVTINGRVPESIAVRAGERIRLRLVNAANARIFALDFADLEPIVIALDGQPVAPYAPSDGLVTLGPAMRMDLILDMTDQPGSRTTVVDRFYQGLEYRLLDLAYAETALREGAPDWPVDLPANPLAEPDLSDAIRHEVTFNGGMMGQMVMAKMGGSMGDGATGGMMNMMHGEGIWFINGKAATGHVMEPLLTLPRDRTCILTMTNATAWHHPIHLHGHSFRVLSRDGQPTAHREWQDTVLMAPREKVEIAFVADNPGDWMFHCHILEHQAAGMMGVIRVTGKDERI